MSARRPLTTAESSVAADLWPPEQRIRGHLRPAGLVHTHTHARTPAHTRTLHILAFATAEKQEQMPRSHSKFTFIYFFIYSGASLNLCLLTHWACLYYVCVCVFKHIYTHILFERIYSFFHYWVIILQFSKNKLYVISLHLIAVKLFIVKMLYVKIRCIRSSARQYIFFFINYDGEDYYYYYYCIYCGISFKRILL